MIIFPSKLKLMLLALSLLFVTFTTLSSAEAKTDQKQKHYSKCYLVPPPPPYVPSMLPELSRYRGYGQAYYSYANSQSSNLPEPYKPNKYLTYYFPKKN